MREEREGKSEGGEEREGRSGSGGVRRERVCMESVHTYPASNTMDTRDFISVNMYVYVHVYHISRGWTCVVHCS